MNISVILPTFNNCNRLQCTLNAFVNLEIPDGMEWELIVVDNNSTDFTKNVVGKFSGKLPVKYIFETKQGISHAKNAGLYNAIGKLIIFTDDDVTPCVSWLKIYWEEYLLNTNDLFWGGPVISDFEILPADMAIISLGPCSVKGLNWGENKKKLAANEFFIGANWAAPSQILKQIGGFNVELGLNASPGKVLIGEENDLMNRLQAKGLTPMYLPGCSIRHFVPKSKMTLEHIASRAEATGRLSADRVMEFSPVCILGVPRWILKKTITLWLKSKLKRLFNINWYADYIAYRQIVGCIKQLKKI